MGSLERATLCGFICRLCSEMHRVVLHIYGDEGIRLCISEKISRYLSINVNVPSTKLSLESCLPLSTVTTSVNEFAFQVSQSDPLPKTICNNCLERLESQHKLMLVMERASNMLKGRQGGQGCGH